MDIGVNIRVEETLEEKVVARLWLSNDMILMAYIQNISKHPPLTIQGQIIVNWQFGVFLQRRGRAPFFFLVLTLRHWISGFRRFHERCRIHL